MRPRMRTVFDTLVAEGLIAAEDAPRVRAGLAGGRSPAPWFLRALLGCGAWTSALLLLGFLHVAELADHLALMMATGAVCVAGALALRRLREGPFVEQLALSASFLGQLLLTSAAAEAGGGAWGAAALSVLSAGLVIGFPDPVHRFVSTLVGCGAVAYLVLQSELAVAPDLALALLAGGTVWAWRAGERLTGTWAALRAPVSAALAVALLAAAAPDSFGVRGGAHAIFGAVVLTVATLTVLVPVVFRAQAPVRVRVGVVAALVVFAALTHRVPALQASVLVVVLAFERRSAVVLSLGAAALVGFLGWYYHSLELTLLAKSAALVGGGAALLVARRLLEGRG